MDRNFLLAFALSFLVLTTWTMWQSERRGEQIPPGETSMAPSGDPDLPEVAPEAVRPTTTTPERRPPPPAGAVEPSAAQPVEAAEVVEIRSPLYEASLSTRGGSLVRWDLLEYRDASEPGRPPVELTTLSGDEVALATPFVEIGAGDLSYAAFEVERLGDHQVVFRRRADGVLVTKRYTFHPESYRFELLLQVANDSSRELEPRFEVVWPARVRENPDFENHMLLVLNEGEVERTPVASVGQPGFFSRLFGGGRETETVLFEGEIDWAGAQTNYFLSVLLPEIPRDAQVRFEPRVEGESGSAIVGYRPSRVPPGHQLEREYRVYIGPKESDRLVEAGASLDRSIDRGYSWVAPLTAAFSWMLRVCYSVVPNYGVAIIILTILVRLATAPLMSKQMRSMKRMTELQPKLKELQQKHGDDKQKQSEEMMKLYRQSGVNPLGGCFPMLLQLPVFIGLYYALQSSIYLRQQPFALWINDLSAPETLFVIPGLELPVRVIPLLMGISMVLQQKMTPTTVDPAQARMMMTVMPVMFTVLFYRFPSGLVLYWFVSNLLGIVHQLWVNRGMQKQPAPQKKAAQPRPRSGRPRKSKA